MTVPNFSRADIIVGYALTPLCIVWVLIARALSERAQRRERRALEAQRLLADRRHVRKLGYR